MKVKVHIDINSSKEAIWAVISDIENATANISGIEKIEILEMPETGLVGLKWRETRTLFGKTATEVMWITECSENDFYRTRAESHGCVYTSTLSISEQNSDRRLSMTLESGSRSIMAKLLSIPMGLAFKGVTRKALQQDIEDIKAVVEKQTKTEVYG